MAFNLFTTRVALFCTLLATVVSGGKLSADMVNIFRILLINKLEILIHMDIYVCIVLMQLIV